MKALDDFNETVGRLTAALSAVQNSTDTFTLSRKEAEAVRILQLLEVQIGAIGQELYRTVRTRHGAILRGEITDKEETSEDNKSSNSGRPKRQSNRKTKRASE